MDKRDVRHSRTVQFDHQGFGVAYQGMFTRCISDTGGSW